MRPLLIAALLLSTIAVPAAAQQQAAIAPRVDRLEKEMRAVQRKVFPGGSQQFLEAEIAPPAQPVDGGVASSTPIADLTARVGSLEQELARLTGQMEQSSFRVRQLEEQFARFKAASEARAAPVDGAAPFAGNPGGPDRLPPPAATPVAPVTRIGGDTPPPATTAPIVDTRGSVDPAEDIYLAGFRLWEQKDYSGAEPILKSVVEKYPKHRRASYAQNLLGRSYLDNRQPARAAEAFYTSYQKFPRGERAADSLYYLGQSLMALSPPKPADACKVYGELIDVYGEKIAQSLKDRVARGRADAKCGA